MNRPIEYRAWHKGFKEFVTVTGLHYFEGNELSGVSFDSDDVGEQQDIPIKWFDLMQYTGLKDKNGKKIFEGDIVRYANDEESGEGIIEAFFNTVNLHCRWIKQKTERPTLYTSIDYLGCAKEIEVIGNIFENPELLKENHG